MHTPDSYPHRSLASSFVAIVLAFVVGASPGYAADFTVDSTDDAVDAAPGDLVCASAAGACTLRAAVQEANAQDVAATITVPAGSYALSITGDHEDETATGDLDVTTDLTVVGTGSDTTTIDGSALTGPDNVFEVFTASFTIRGLTIQGAPLGAIAGGGTVLIDQCVLRENSFGAYLLANGLTILDSRIEENFHGVSQGFGFTELTRTTVSDNEGVGVHVYGNTVGTTITDSVIERNAHGLLIERGSGAVIRSQILSNRVTGIEVRGSRGAATIDCEDSIVHANGSGIVLSGIGHGGIINRCTISNNLTVQPGAGIWHHGACDEGPCHLLVTNSTISNNRSGFGGGGITAESPMTIVNTTIVGNAGRYGGVHYAGAPCCSDQPLRLRNVTIANNSFLNVFPPVVAGGGVTNASIPEAPGDPGAAIELENTVIAANTNPDGQPSDCNGALASKGHNLLQTTAGCAFASGVGDVVDVAPLLGPLADNGGPTPTAALLAGSPAIDAGDPTGCRDENDEPLTIDQRGATRPQFARCDIGAFELACGNGTVDLGETCDDGNTADGDCCSSACIAAEEGGACDDGSACTTPDTCIGGACAPGAPLECGVCATCEVATGCVGTPSTGCHTPTKRFSGQLALSTGRPKITWKWTTGQATNPTDFGDPIGGDEYTLCIFDESGPRPQAVFGARTRSGACGAKPCWRSVGTDRFAYKDPARTPDGLDGVLLRSGAEGKARVLVSGKGPTLPLPALPLALPARVQLQAPNGQCWEARYFDLGVVRNSTSEFKASAFTP